jgi:GT2 family glycosyltransferase
VNLPRPDAAPRFSVVVLNWDGLDLLQACLGALAAQTWRDFQVLVVDNGSTDGSRAWLAEHAATVTVIGNSTNLGFATANNQGFRAARGAWLIALNNDTLPAPDWLERLAEAADADPAAGMLASRILLAQQPGLIDSLGIEVDRAGLGWNRAWARPVAEWPAGRPERVFGPSGAAAAYRRAMLDEIGLFDDELFIYYEDIDLAWRAQWAGWPGLYVPGAVVHHIHSATTRRGSPFKRRLLSRNKWWVIAKNYPFAQLWPYVPAMLALDLAATVVAVLTERNLAAVRGRWEALRGWRRFRAKRRDATFPRRPPPDWRTVLAPIHWRQR